MAQWVKDAALLTAVAWVTAVVHMRAVAWELPHSMGTTKKKREKKKKKKKKRKAIFHPWPALPRAPLKAGKGAKDILRESGSGGVSKAVSC